MARARGAATRWRLPGIITRAIIGRLFAHIEPRVAYSRPVGQIDMELSVFVQRRSDRSKTQSSQIVVNASQVSRDRSFKLLMPISLTISKIDSAIPICILYTCFYEFVEASSRRHERDGLFTSAAGAADEKKNKMSNIEMLCSTGLRRSGVR